MQELKTVKLDQIAIPDVRVNSVLNEEQRALMASTIKEIGVVQDIIVRSVGIDAYELVAGRSRLEELLRQGMTESRVKVISVDEKLGLTMNIVENIARGGFNYISVSRAIRRLKELGSSSEELERVFPWRRRWIEFIEMLQDLPDDVVTAISSRKITPSHVQLALNLPTPAEVHDGLRTAITHEWDTGTFKIFVQNRLEQISRAEQEASAKGAEPTIPPAMPEQLISYQQCLVCGYKKPAEQVTVLMICEGCRNLAKYLTDQLGPPEKAIKTVYAAMQAYFGAIDAQRAREFTPEGLPSPG